MGKKVLIVEDEEDFLWQLRQGFEHQGLSLIYAHDGEEGLAMAEKEKPDLVLIDIQMPKMDGISMAKKIKERGITSQMIFLTNLKYAEHISEAIDLSSASDYILKSDMHIKDIVARVKDKLGVK